MKRHYRTLFITTAVMAAAACFLWLIFLSGDIFYTGSRNGPNREALLKIRSDLSAGDGHREVLIIYWRDRTDDLRISVESPDTWSVRTPSEPGARNWVLYVRFGSGGSVSACEVRTEDGPRPASAPEAIQF